MFTRAEHTHTSPACDARVRYRMSAPHLAAHDDCARRRQLFLDDAGAADDREVALCAFFVTQMRGKDSQR